MWKASPPQDFRAQQLRPSLVMIKNKIGNISMYHIILLYKTLNLYICIYGNVLGPDVLFLSELPLKIENYCSEETNAFNM